MPTLAAAEHFLQSPVPISTRVPDEQWAALAPRIAGRNAICVSKDGGRTYKARNDRSLGVRPPNQPAAAFIYNARAETNVIVIDLDSTLKTLHGTGERRCPDVERDLSLLRRSLRQAGVRFVVDGSPNGGRHIYIPVAEALAQTFVHAYVQTLRREYPSIDPSPTSNASRGLIRPTGARHRSGGFQVLIGELSEAIETFNRPNPVSSVLAYIQNYSPSFVSLIARGQSRVDSQRPEEHVSAVRDVRRLNPSGRRTEIDGKWRHIAVTGQYEDLGYHSGSEARQAVLWAAASVGMSLTQVASRVEDGTWRGLASLYKKYGAIYRRKTLADDFRAAVEFEQTRRARGGNVHSSTTRAHQTSAPMGSRQFVRSWINVIEVRYSRSDLAVRAVLAAVSEAAMKRQSQAIEFGNRSLSLSASVDQSSVGRILNLLAAEDDPVLVRTREAEGVYAHEYTLRMPIHSDGLERKPFKNGMILGIRPAFRELGLPAAFVYAVLERAVSPHRVRDIAERSFLSAGAAQDALLTLSVYGLAERTKGGWILGSSDVARIAELLEVDVVIVALVERFRAERRAWWIRLGVILGFEEQGNDSHAPPDPHESLQYDPHDQTLQMLWPDRATTEPFQDEFDERLFGSALDLVESLLGGRLVA